MLYENALSEFDFLKKQTENLENKLRQYPENKLMVFKNNGSLACYEMLPSGKRKYLPKRERGYAMELALGTYYRALLSDMKMEMQALRRYIGARKYCNKTDKLKANAGMMKIVNEALQAFTEDKQPDRTGSGDIKNRIRKWVMEEYESTAGHEESLTVKSATGRMVRSKSEAWIDWELKSHGIPYRYECDLDVLGVKYHPDFTIMHPRTGEIILWEHLGIMDSGQYVKSSYSKLQAYASIGFIPMQNLILTSESYANPLNQATVIKIIETFLL